jgi:hypothetical protein
MDSFQCERCESFFTTKRSLKIHIDNPPKKCRLIAAKLKKKVESRRKPDSDSDSEYDSDSIANGSQEYLKSNLLQRYIKEGTRQMVDKDAMANVTNLHQSLNPSNDEVHQLMKETQQKLVDKHNTFVASAQKTTEMIDGFKEKWGDRSEEQQFFADVQNQRGAQLLRTKKLLMCKLHAAETMLLKHNGEVDVLNALNQFFGQDYVRRLNAELQVNPEANGSMAV